MSNELIDSELRDRAAESLALEMDITFNQAEEILESMDNEVKEV